MHDQSPPDSVNGLHCIKAQFSHFTQINCMRWKKGHSSVTRKILQILKYQICPDCLNETTQRYCLNLSEEGCSAGGNLSCAILCDAALVVPPLSFTLRFCIWHPHRGHASTFNHAFDLHCMQGSVLAVCGFPGSLYQMFFTK